MNVISDHESRVSCYSRQFRTVFQSGKGGWLKDVNGKNYLDCFLGSGALNYGHNDAELIKSLQEYISSDGVVQGLDMATTSKQKFLKDFHEIILVPRQLEYRVQLAGPGGANAVEAAIRLARKITGRTRVIYFENSYHGMTEGARSVSDMIKDQVNSCRSDNLCLPFRCESESEDRGSRLSNMPEHEFESAAAVIIETVQIEGGVRVADKEWLQEIQRLCNLYGVLLIIDDIQAGIGRSGSFFSFESSGICPDLVILSKSLSGLGLPLSIVLIKPQYDVWDACEYTGTFRGLNYAFVTASAAMDKFWRDGELENAVNVGSVFLFGALKNMQPVAYTLPIRRKGLVFGLEFPRQEQAVCVQQKAFSDGLLVGICGKNKNVIKIMPSLLSSSGELTHAVETLRNAIGSVSLNRASN